MQISAEKLAFTLRAKYLDSLMRQETAYFEKQQIEALPAKISEYFTEIPNSVGEKFSQCLMFIGMFVGGFGLSFYFAPNYAALLVIYLPIFILLISGYGALAKGQTIAKITQNAKLGGYTEEILGALKLVISFGQE